MCILLTEMCIINNNENDLILNDCIKQLINMIIYNVV